MSLELSMGLEPHRGHLKYRRTQSAPQPGQSAKGLSRESLPRFGAAGQPGCWGSDLPLTQCCQSNPGEKKVERV